jgi:hypothetical protein
MDKILLTSTDYEEFRKWIGLNLEGITWQGRYEKEFEEFWDLFFTEGLSLSQIIERFNYAKEEAKLGPLSSWFVWLKERFLCYIFINKEINIYELSNECQISPSYLAGIFRNFFIDLFPHLEEELSCKFQIGNLASPNLYLSGKQLKLDLSLEDDFSIEQLDDVMKSIEITLYQEWHEFLEKMKKDLFHANFNFKNVRDKASFKLQFRFLRDLFAIIIVGVIFVYGIKTFNKWYEKYLVDKISIYEPQFLWTDKTLKFKERITDNVKDSFERNLDDIENVENNLVETEVVKVEERFETESDVTLSSWDSLPKDFDTAELEQSSYEELKKGGFRDTRYGGKTVYRVMMRSVDTSEAKGKVTSLLKAYKAGQVGNVKAGTNVPGGVYYNLVIPREHLKEFLARVMEVDDATLYESHTRWGNPPGKNKVFIWIKSM